MTVTLRVVRPPAMTAVTTPVTTHDIYWKDENNGPGAGEFTIALDDPARALIQINDLAIITRDATDVAMVLIEMIHERTLHEQGGASLTATYSGRLAGAMLEWALVAPALGDQAKPVEEDAVFDWRSTRYRPAMDPWVAANQIMTVTTAKAGGAGGWPTQPMGEDFTETTGAYMIWSSAGTASTAPAGTCLFYKDITIPNTGRHGLECLMDNDGFVFVDGTQVLEIHQNDGYHRVSFKRIELTAGVHRFAFQVRNIDGPGALAYNLFKTDQQDRPMPGVAVISKSDLGTKVLPYPVPFPGMTVGEILADLLGEAAARGSGALTWVAPSFSLTLDSNGTAWGREVGITTKTGTTTMLQLLDELVAGGRISQWRYRPDGVTFDVFGPAYTSRPTPAGFPGGVVLAPSPVNNPATGQVLELERRIT